MPLRIGFIGGGMISQIAHLPFYMADQRCEVAALAESRPSLVAALSEKLGAERIVADHRRILDDRSIDAVVIVAPRAASGPLALEALEASKHVLVEKPMAHTAAQGRRLATLAIEKRRICAVGYMKRYDSGVAIARQIVEARRRDNLLGDLQVVRFYNFSRAYAIDLPPHTRPQESRSARFATWPQWPEWLPPEHRGAYEWFLNSASHDVNLVHHFFPDAVEVDSAVSHDSGSVCASLRSCETPIQFAVTKTAAGVWIEGAEFVFERGRIGVEIPSPMDMHRAARVRVDSSEPAVGQAVLPADVEWPFARQARDFVDCLLGRSTPGTDFCAGVRDLELCEAIWRQVAVRA